MNQDSARIRIMIVDDHAVVRMGLAALINTQDDMELVAEAENGREAVEMFGRHRPDVTLMDLRLPVMGGAEATEAIRRNFSDARIVILSTYSGTEDIYRSFHAGARGYLLKAMLRKELLAAIRAVHAGQRLMPPEIAARLAERIPCSDLTEREAEVLGLIVQGRSYRQAATELGITEATVKYHMKLVFSKLGVADRAQAVTAAIQRGIVHLD